jgi:Uma2 family endonuclease
MSAVPKSRKLTVAEYLEIEQAAAHKSEFYDGEMFPVHPPAGPRMMAGASKPHNIVFRNLLLKLGARLGDDGPCQLFAADQRVKIDAHGHWCYPDILIVCGEPEYAADDPDALTNPKVVIEVLSPATERYDRTTKVRHYAALPSVQEYVLVAQDEPLVERYVRLPDGQWGRAEFAGLDATLALATVAASVPMADVYRRVAFPPRPAP